MRGKATISIISDAQKLYSRECHRAYLANSLKLNELSSYRPGGVILMCCQALSLTDAQIVKPSHGHGDVGNEDHSNVYSI